MFPESPQSLKRTGEAGDAAQQQCVPGPGFSSLAHACECTRHNKSPGGEWCRTQVLDENQQEPGRLRLEQGPGWRAGSRHLPIAECAHGSIQPTADQRCSQLGDKELRGPSAPPALAHSRQCPTPQTPEVEPSSHSSDVSLLWHTWQAQRAPKPNAEVKSSI